MMFVRQYIKTTKTKHPDHGTSFPVFDVLALAVILSVVSDVSISSSIVYIFNTFPAIFSGLCSFHYNVAFKR